MVSSPVEIGKRVLLAREFAGLSARRLGDLAGLSGPYILGLEKGRYASPGAGALGQVAGVLGLDLAWLLSGAGTPPEPEIVRAAVDEAIRAQGAKRRSRPCPHCGLDTLVKPEAA